MIYPKFYHYKNRVSDLNWILRKMAVIPEDKKKEVSMNYENIYLSQGRRAPNEYLHGVAVNYKADR